MLFSSTYPFNLETFVFTRDRLGQVEGVRKKSGQSAKEPNGTGPEKTPGLDCKGPVTLSKMCRGYSMKVRGELPADIVERISRLHSAALRAIGQPERSRAEGTDDPENKGD